MEESDFASAVELFGGKPGDTKLHNEDLSDPARKNGNNDDDDDDDDDDDGGGKAEASGKAPAGKPKAAAKAAAVGALDDENPKTEQEFAKYAALVSQTIVRHRDSVFYYSLLLNVLKTSLAERPVNEMTDLAQALTKMANEKQKKEKEAADAKKKAKNAAKNAKKKLASDFVEDDIDRYGAKYEEDYDF